jgi:hypothetical protein
VRAARDSEAAWQSLCKNQPLQGIAQPYHICNIY